MFMETGFENALFDSTVQIIRELDADVVLVSKAQYALMAQQKFSRQRIYQAMGGEGVEAVYPVYIETRRAVWQQTRRKGDPIFKQYRSRGSPIRVIACDLSAPVFLSPQVAEHAPALRQPDTALVDANSKMRFYDMPASEEERFARQGAELCGRAIRLVGTFEMGTDFINDGNLIMSDTNFARYFPFRMPGGDPLSVVDIGVVRVKKGTDPDVVVRRLRDTLPDDVNVRTKADYVNAEIGFWSSSTPIGYVFLVGTLLGWVVGVIICYQIIHADIADHMPEFATLKAMGYRNRYFVGVVLQQSLLLSALGFVPGLLISLALYQWLASTTGLLMMLNFRRAVVVLVLTTAMCIFSGCLAMRKVLAADPAELF